MADPEKHVSKRTCLKSKRSRFILAVGLLIVIIAAVVPSVVVTTLRKKNNMGPKAKVFVPLYVYPAPGAWAPLENVISSHPDVNFTVVINPGNGPGPDSLPDGNYTREIPKLTAYENVRLLGYVYTSYGKRNVSAVRNDIQTYADWPTNSSNPNLAVRGIFFDETPQQYDAQILSYLQGLTDFVKDIKGLGPDQFVVHNPGAVPDSRYLATADSTVVFEAAYTTFQERQGAKLFANIENSNRTQLCAIVHSVPESVEGTELRSLVKQVRKVADEVYITHLSTDYYASFGAKWTEFVDLMAA
ncbi:Spherulation-specific family 4 [Penicillium coprophilum]|uniref:Spherulation-specific family 4 n=1 Tax=Penicillium coprophilum TaxID=36646 RepID=UPI0023A4E043|nr:Spherulation-specific family 4 [Penicillium coprophilum]KAJ5154294.1 Spherulation-specific family 4 [Penicillium coprophilum]